MTLLIRCLLVQILKYATPPISSLSGDCIPTVVRFQVRIHLTWLTKDKWHGNAVSFLTEEGGGSDEDEWHPELIFLHVVDEVKDVIPGKLMVR